MKVVDLYALYKPYNVSVLETTPCKAMNEPRYTDEENPSNLVDRTTLSQQHNRTSFSAISMDDEEDYKKIEHYHEMAQVHRLTHRIYAQCLLLLVAIGIGLVFITTNNNFKSTNPLANGIFYMVAIVVFIILAFLAVTCGYETAQTKLILIIMISIFLGLSCGFLMALNGSMTSQAPTYNAYNTMG